MLEKILRICCPPCYYRGRDENGVNGNSSAVGNGLFSKTDDGTNGAARASCILLPACAVAIGDGVVAFAVAGLLFGFHASATTKRERENDNAGAAK